MTRATGRRTVLASVVAGGLLGLAIAGNVTMALLEERYLRDLRAACARAAWTEQARITFRHAYPQALPVVTVVSAVALLPACLRVVGVARRQLGGLLGVLGVLVALLLIAVDVRGLQDYRSSPGDDATTQMNHPCGFG